MRNLKASLNPYFTALVVCCALLLGAGNAVAGGKDWKAETKQGEITIMRGGEKMAVVKTESPNIEETRFLKWQGKKCLAVKSRGEHGPAALKLFDVHTGSLVDKVMAFAVENGQPAWAAARKE